MQDSHIIHFRACEKGMFYTYLDDPNMVTNPIYTSVNTYYFLSTLGKTLNFSLILKLKEREKFENCSNISTGQEHQPLNHIYQK